VSQHYYLLDTNIVGHLAKLKSGDRSAESLSLQRRLNDLPNDTKLLLCPISIGEIEAGLQVDYPHTDKQTMAREIIATFDCLNINANIARHNYAVLRGRLFNRYAPKGSDNRKKKRINEWKDPTTSDLLQADENDLWIAAVAMAHNLILVTRDKMTAIKAISCGDVLFENWIDE
jgi:tRNA(fMet)-specific endonuclease VapC